MLLGQLLSCLCQCGDAVASWLVPSSPDRFRIRGLAGDTVLCSWSRNLTLMVPLSTQMYIKGIGKPCYGLVSHRSDRNTPSRIILKKSEIIRRPVWSLGSYSDVTYLPASACVPSLPWLQKVTILEFNSQNKNGTR